MSTETAEAPAESTEAKPARVKKVVEPTPCACAAYTGKNAKGETLTTGCTATTVRTFGPGHDAKLKSLLIATHVAGNQVVKTVDGNSEEMDPVYAAEEFGFRAQVEKGKETADKKAAAKTVNAEKRQQARDAKAAETEKKKAEAKAKREAAKAKNEAIKAAEDKLNQDKAAGPAKARIGRKEYDGEVLEDGQFKYTNEKGEEVETDKYRLLIDPSTVTVASN